MDKESLDVEHTSKDVTVVISRKIKPGYENEYDEWFRRYLMLERKVPGFVGTTCWQATSMILLSMINYL
ncbi:MAG: hypothetical protein WBZ36_30815 [Candidatus Nitrosopolaris sp.]|jgi:antibiotic biosynthesis monooxygenase (ABM) superfamily enzyme